MNSYVTTADATLNTLAKRLADTPWHTELDAEELQTGHDLQTVCGSARHMIAVMRDYRTCAARMYLGGAQRTLGLFTGADITPLLRYADMARMYFWKYQVRGAFEPTDGDLNFSADRAKSDLANEPDVLALLQQIEAHLKSIGAIRSPEDRERLRQQEVAQGRERPTLSRHVRDLEACMRAQFVGVLKQLADLRALQSETQSAIARVNALVSELAARPQALSPSDSYPPGTWVTTTEKPVFLPSTFVCDGNVSAAGGTSQAAPASQSLQSPQAPITA